MSYSPWDRVSDNITFDRFPHLGFEIGTDPGQKARFAFWRQGGPADDWQVTKRVESRQAVLSTRVVRQRLPDGPMVLDTGLWFRAGADYRTFLALSSTAGTLRMNRNATMHQADRTVTLLGRTYAEFDNVHVIEINAQSFDLDGGVRCHVIFERDAPAYTIATLKPFPPAPYPLAPLHTPLTVMDSPPEITVGAAGGSTVIGGSVFYDKDDEVFVLFGCHAKVGPSFPDDGYMSPLFADSAGEIVTPAVWGVEVETDAAEIELRMKGTGTSNAYRLTIDGEGYDAQGGHVGLPADGDSHLVHYDFGTAEWRRLRWEFVGGVGFGGMRAPADATVQASQRTLGPKVILMGDSQAEGTGADSNISGYGDMLYQMLGWRDLTMSGLGGTGLLNPGSHVTYGDRVQEDVIDHAPDVVIVQLTGNDMPVWTTVGDYQTALDTLLDDIVTGLPDATLVVIWPWHDNGNPTETLLLIRDQGVTYAATHGAEHIDALGGPVPYSGDTGDYADTGWITGNGGVGIGGSSGNAAIYISNDSTHFSQAGHDYMGRKLVDAIAARLPALIHDVPWVEPGTEPPPVVGPADYVELITDHGADLAAWWRFGESSGATAQDATANNVDATITSIGAYSAAGAISGDSDTALTFNGTSSQVSVTVGALGDPYTMECWFYPTAAGWSSAVLNGYLMVRGVGTAYDGIGIMGTLFGADAGKIFVSNDVTWWRGTTVITPNVWHHVLFTRNGGAVKVYLDGALEIDDTLSNAFAGSDAITIGSREDDDWWFAGRIDEPAVYTTDLTADDASDHYDYGIGALP